MRKLISFFLLLSVVTLHARQILPGEAAAIASEFLKSSPTRLKPTRSDDPKRVMAKTAAVDNESQPYYVFNGAKGCGFVIISGDDRVRKILGYSDTGNFDFDNLPPQLADLLDQYVKQIDALPASATTDPSWSKASRAAVDDEGILLETANWGQSYPYNLQTPIIDGEHCPTGCVATAMAIVMKYHNWPESYNWDAMPNTQLETPVESLSKLMADAGEAVLMNYTLNESGAHMNWIGHRLHQTFNFSPECQYITRVNFSDEEWVSMLRGNLDSNEPVIYNGSGTGNHAFIIDGYENDTYHINWGWDGMCNGYFYLDALTPNESQDFSSNCGMVINITPDRSGKVYSKVFCDQGYFWANGGLCPGAHFSIDSPGQNQTFDYSCHTLSYPYSESGELGLLLCDKDGNVNEILKTQVFLDMEDNSGLGIWGSPVIFAGISISSITAPDDYITLATRESLSQPWTEVLGTLEAPVKFKIKDISKEVSIIRVINNATNTKLSYNIMGNDWMPIDSDIMECVIGGQFSLCVDDEQSGLRRDNVSIKVEGRDVYGNTNITYDGFRMFGVYDDSYTITIDDIVVGIEKNIDLTEAGTLSNVLDETEFLNIDMLTVTGYINAKDLWFIRENLKTLKSLDISDCKILACEATDPVEIFRIGGSEHPENILPTYALTGLTQLSFLKLPENLVYIESNSLMSLAIEQIEIPTTVQGIGLNVFFDCTRLNTVISRMVEPPFINECVFTNTMCPSSGVLYVPVGSVESYRQIEVWKEFAQIIEGEGQSTGDETVFFEGLKYRVQGDALYLMGYEQSQLPEDVIIPDKILVDDIEYNVLGIDDNAMQNADMKTFVMSNSITTIGSYLFSGSTVKQVIMSDNIKSIPFKCIDGERIEDIHLPENGASICNSIYCPNLKKIHLPKNLHSEPGFDGSIGQEFRSLEEITVDPENEEWNVHDGILYWDGLSHLIRVPNTISGELIIPDETISIQPISNCPNITKIVFGKGFKSVMNGSIIMSCENLLHIEFNDNMLFSSNGAICALNKLESYSIGDFLWGNEDCFSYLPSLKYVYIKSSNAVNFGGRFYYSVNPDHDYFTSSLNPQATVPYGCKIYVPGGIKLSRSAGSELADMWKYEIDKLNGKVKIEPLIEGLAIDKVVINGVHKEMNSTGLYEYEPINITDLEVTVEFTLHGRQHMTTHYDKEFNATMPDTDLSGISEIVVDDGASMIEVYNVNGIMVMKADDKAQLDQLSAGVYVVRQGSSVKKFVVK